MNTATQITLLTAAAAVTGTVVGSTAGAGRRPEQAATAPAARAVQLNSAVSGVVASIAGAGVYIRCAVPDNAGQYGALGHADWKLRLIELAPSLCRRLNALAPAAAPPSTPAANGQAQALLVLVHESVHLSSFPGRRDEALTECRAIQLVRQAALTVAIDDVTARALGHEALRYDARLPGLGDWRVGLHEIANYHAPNCHDGGALDIHPDSHDWPN